MKLSFYLIVMFVFIVDAIAINKSIINKTNVNPVTDLFDRELDSKESVFDMIRNETEFFKKVITEGDNAEQLKLTDDLSVFQQLTKPDDTHKISTLEAIKVEDMEAEGYHMWQQSDDYKVYRDLAIDEDDYSFYRNSASELFSYTDRKLNSIMDKLRELGISDCEKQLVTENTMGKYEIHSEPATITEENYAPQICESVRNKYICHRHLVLHCTSHVQQSLADIISSDLPLISQKDNRRELVFGIKRLFGGAGTQYDYEISFDLLDKQGVEILLIDHIAWNDHIRITVNDVQVFMGSMTGDRLELLPQKGQRYNEVMVDGSGKTYSAEFNTWYSQDVKIDLRPYLLSGKNIIKIRLIVAGKGGITLRFQNLLRSCQEWSESWEELCTLE